jgi:hypothetical protein
MDGQLEEGVAGCQTAVAYGGQQRHAPLQRDQPGGDGGVGDGAGQVNEYAASSPRSGGDHDDAAGA